MRAHITSNTPHIPDIPHIEGVPGLQTVGLADLMTREYPPIKMVVDGLIPSGLLLLAAAPKAGKSLLMLDLALSAMTGDTAWGKYAIDPGDVLYISLEGGERSFYSRVASMMCDRRPTNVMRAAFECEKLGGPLESQIGDWMSSVEDPRLVVIDTLTAVSPETRGVNRMQEDYELVNGLTLLSVAFPNSLIVLVHHTRKGIADDVMQLIAGAHGLTAATDGNAVLIRQVASNRATLHLRPRNAEEAELVLQRSPETLRYSVVSEDESAHLSRQRQAVLGYLASVDVAGPTQIAKAVGASNDATRTLLGEMVGAGHVVKPARGQYCLPMSDTEPDEEA